MDETVHGQPFEAEDEAAAEPGVESALAGDGGTGDGGTGDGGTGDGGTGDGGTGDGGTGDGGTGDHLTGWDRVVRFLLMSALAIAALIAIPIAVVLIRPTAEQIQRNYSTRFPAEISLTVILVAGAATVVALLGLVMGSLNLFGLSNREQPFGMPQGTISSIIALFLVLIFAIIPVFLFGQTSRTTQTLSTGITESQLAQIPQSQIIEVHARTLGTQQVFDVSRSIPQSTDTSSRIADQLVTTISTLVAAIASFYFATKAVETAHSTAAKAAQAATGGSGGGGPSFGGQQSASGRVGGNPPNGGPMSGRRRRTVSGGRRRLTQKGQ
jgi:hypothetical protein